MELLVPAGDINSFYAALNNGADAVYLSGKMFGARSYAKNFTEDELKTVLKLGKIYGIKIYVTMNTLVKENEVEDFLKEVEFLYNLGVDAILMQDFGMISLCLKKYPNLEIHASTQVNSSSYETIKLLYEMGVKRVVLPREMSIDEIKKIDIPIELEAFIHGALCVSYSGNCLFSSMLGGRSGNRGECVGSCRLPYKLYKDKTLIDEGRVIFGSDENKIIELKVYAKEYMDKLSSVYELDGRLGSYDMKALFPEAKQLFKNPKPVQLLQRLMSFVLEDDDIFVDFFSGSGTSAEAALRTIVQGKSISFIQVQIEEKTKIGSEARELGYATIDALGIERIVRAAAKIRMQFPETIADLGFRHYTLVEPSGTTLDKLEEFSPDDAGMYVTNTILEDFGVPTVLATWLVRDGYGFTAPVEAIDFAGYTGYYMGKHLYLINQDLSNEAITAITEKYETDGAFNPENVVLFGYSFKWTEMESLKTNLARLRDTEKNLRINYDIRY